VQEFKYCIGMVECRKIEAKLEVEIKLYFNFTSHVVVKWMWFI
jgi:hypothetical protein